MIAPQLDRISDYVGHWAQQRPQAEALVGTAGRWTYRDLRADVDQCAMALLAHGVRRGDRVALLGHPRPEFFVVFLASASIGAIWVGLNPKYTITELTHVVGNSQPSVIFGFLAAGDSAQADKLRQLREVTAARIVTGERGLPGLSTGYSEFVDVAASEWQAELHAARLLVEPADPAAMVYTSGTTGAPKGALVPHYGLALCSSIQADRWYGEATRKLCDLPINHIGCLGDICCSVLTAGGTVVFMERFDPDGALKVIERERLTHWLAIPTQLLAAVKSPAWAEAQLHSLERIIWAGAAAPRGLLDALATSGARLCTSYGLTESTGSVTYTDDDDTSDILTWSIGRVDPRYELRLGQPDGSAAAPGTAGEVLIRGDFITRGYFRNPEATRATIDDDGWLHTGDLATEEAGGRLRLVGRLKEMYKSGGYNVYPREVEIALERHPAVALAAVVGIPDERWGEAGHAFVVVREPVTSHQLADFCRTSLANYKIPKAFSFEAELPTLPVGKVDKAELRRRSGSP